MKYTHNSNQTTAMVKAFSQVVLKINITSMADTVKKNLETSPGSLLIFRETIKKLNEKSLELFTLIPFKVLRQVL